MNFAIISVPKSGTYLMNSILSSLIGEDYESDFRFGHEGERELTKTIHGIFISSKQGCLLTHAFYDGDLYSYLMRHGFCTVFIYRHPFDVAVSFVKGSVAHLFADQMSDHLRRRHRDSDEDKYLTLLRGNSNIRHPNAIGLEAMYRRRLGWIDEVTPVLSVKYEDVIGEELGGNDNSETIEKLARHFRVDVKDMRLAFNATIGVRSEASPTFREGSVGQWRDIFTERLVAEYTAQLQPLLTQLGYEV
jgi:hypothetical protein